MAAIAFWAAAAFTILLFIRPNEIIQAWNVSGLHRIFGILALVTSLPALRGRLQGLFGQRLFVFYLIYLAAMLISIPFSAWPGGSFGFLLDTVSKQTAIAFVLLVALREERHIVLISKMIVYSTLVVAVYAVVVFLGGENLVAGYRAALDRGVFQDPNDLGLHFVFAVPPAYFVLLRTAKRKWVPAAVIACLCAGILVTFSRGSMLGLIATVLAVIYFDREKRKWNLLVAAAAVAAIVLAFPPAIERLYTAFDKTEEASKMQRWSIMKKGVVIFAENPIIGVGLRSFAIIEGRTHAVGAWKDAHNSLLQVAAETGILGLIGYAGCLYMILAAPRPPPASTPRLQLLQAGIKSSAIGYIVCGMFLSQAYSWYFIYLIGLTLSFGKLFRKDGGNDREKGIALVA